MLSVLGPIRKAGEGGVQSALGPIRKVGGGCLPYDDLYLGLCACDSAWGMERGGGGGGGGGNWSQRAAFRMNGGGAAAPPPRAYAGSGAGATPAASTGATKQKVPLMPPAPRVTKVLGTSNRDSPEPATGDSGGGCHGNFDPLKILVPDQYFQKILVRSDQFYLKKMVRRFISSVHVVDIQFASDGGD